MNRYEVRIDWDDPYVCPHHVTLPMVASNIRVAINRALAFFFSSTTGGKGVCEPHRKIGVNAIRLVPKVPGARGARA